jgi:hypothetical protein
VRPKAGTWIAVAYVEPLFDLQVRGVKPMQPTLNIRLSKDAILSIVETQPRTVRQIVHFFNSNSYEVVKHLSNLVRHGQIGVKSINGQLTVFKNKMTDSGPSIIGPVLERPESNHYSDSAIKHTV